MELKQKIMEDYILKSREIHR